MGAAGRTLHGGFCQPVHKFCLMQTSLKWMSVRLHMKVKTVASISHMVCIMPGARRARSGTSRICWTMWARALRAAPAPSAPLCCRFVRSTTDMMHPCMSRLGQEQLQPPLPRRSSLVAEPC